MTHQNAIFDLGSQSMFRIIRSARSRLARERSTEPRDDEKHAATNATEDRTSKLSGLSRSAFGRHRLSRSNGSGPCSSENAAPEKPQQPLSLGGGVLSDVTNISVAAPAVDAISQEKASLSEALSGETGHARQWHSTSAPTSGNCDHYECDLQHTNDAQHAIEYVPDVHRALLKAESNPDPLYMDRQVYVNARMRGILVDWLVSVQMKYKLKAETLFLAVSITDRYLELQVTARRNLQLIGITSMLIAAKFEEIHPPNMNDFVYVTDKAYTKDEIVKMEVLILGTLDFKICTSTATMFLDRYQRVNGCTESHRDLAQFLLELTLVDYNMVKYSPSHLAAAAVLLSNKLLKRRPSWSSANVKQTCFSEQALRECAKEMCGLLEHAEHNSLQAVRKKFSQPKYNSVAKRSFTDVPPVNATSESGRGDASHQSVSGERRRSIGMN